MSARTSTLNLLPKDDLDMSWWGRFLKWALSTGRYIIIITEMMVIMAFLSRFKLDQDLSDLADRIEGKKNVLTALSESETSFREVQGRLETAKTMLGRGIPVDNVLKDVEKDLPNQVRFNLMSVDVGSLTLAAETASESGLGEFIKNVNINPRWKSVEIADVSGDRLGGIKFNVRLVW